MLIKCPNPECGKRIPSYSEKCEFCNTIISSKDKVPIENIIPEYKDNFKSDLPQPSYQPRTWSVNYPSLIPFSLSGVIHGSIGLTPKQITTQLGGPSFFSTHASFKFNPHRGAQTLYQGAYDLKVFKGGLIFPERCPITLDTPDHAEIYEMLVSKRGMGKVTFYAKREIRESIVNALCCDRYWYAVPFSKNHGKSDKGIHFMMGKVTVKGKIQSEITIKNLQYAQEFAKLNHLENGRWCNSKHVSFIIGGFLMFVIGLVILATTIFLSEIDGGLIDQNPIFIISMILVTLSGLGITMVGSKGEKL